MIQLRTKKQIIAEPVEMLRLSPRKEEHILWVKVDLLFYMNKIFKAYYPNFDIWYQSRVLSGFFSENRIIYAARSGGNIYGVSILKRSTRNNSTNKICSFYISPEVRGESVGQKLMEKSLGEFSLSTKPVLITVPEERLLEDMTPTGFLSFLQSNKFVLVEEIINKYRFGKKEFIFLRASKNIKI